MRARALGIPGVNFCQVLGGKFCPGIRFLQFLTKKICKSEKSDLLAENF